MILGSMTFCLARAGLWPLPEIQEANLSVRAIYGKLRGLIIHDIGKESTDAKAVDHKGCNPEAYLLDQVERVMSEIPSPLAEFHIQYLEEQANKLSI